MNSKKIPLEWFEYRNQAAYFITYYGDIYHGYLEELPNYENGFFILSKNQSREFQKLKAAERTLEKYRKLAREIQDKNVIRKIVSVPNGHQLGHKTTFKSLSYNSNQHFKRMFVFGAAASAFCVFGKRGEQFRNSSLNPPTGIELFDEKYDTYCQRYPGVMQSISRFEMSGKDIEACMENEWQQFKASYNPRVANRHINIQYYMRELFQDISVYVKEKQQRNNLYGLFSDIIQKHTNQNPKERIGVVSFNYDTILEKFIEEKFGLGYQKMDDYIDWNRRNALVFKPHGSWNWGWQFNQTRKDKKPLKVTAEDLYAQQIEPWQIYYNLIGDLNSTVASNSWGHETTFNKHRLGRLTINKNLLKVFPNGNHENYFPALLLPYRDKDEFVMPYDHYSAMELFFEKMEELYLIGWKGNEALFNRQLGKRARNLKKIIIANPNAKEVIKIFREQTGLDIDKYEIVTINDFEEFVLKYIEPALAK